MPLQLLEGHAGADGDLRGRVVDRARARRSRLRLSTTSPCSGTEPPTRPVLPPWGTRAVPLAAQAATTAATSSVEPGRTTAGGPTDEAARPVPGEAGAEIVADEDVLVADGVGAVAARIPLTPTPYRSWRPAGGVGVGIGVGEGGRPLLEERLDGLDLVRAPDERPDDPLLGGQPLASAPRCRPG